MFNHQPALGGAYAKLAGLEHWDARPAVETLIEWQLSAPPKDARYRSQQCLTLLSGVILSAVAAVLAVNQLVRAAASRLATATTTGHTRARREEFLEKSHYGIEASHAHPRPANPAPV